MPSGRPKAAGVGSHSADADRYCRPGEHGRHPSRGGARHRRRSRSRLVVGAGGALQPSPPRSRRIDRDAAGANVQSGGPALQPALATGASGAVRHSTRQAGKAAATSRVRAGSRAQRVRLVGGGQRAALRPKDVILHLVHVVRGHPVLVRFHAGVQLSSAIGRPTGRSCSRARSGPQHGTRPAVPRRRTAPSPAGQRGASLVSAHRCRL